MLFRNSATMTQRLEHACRLFRTVREGQKGSLHKLVVPLDETFVVHLVLSGEPVNSHEGNGKFFYTDLTNHSDVCRLRRACWVKIAPVFYQIIKCLVFLAFICSTGIALGSDQEFGHPLFRTFTAHDYGEVGQIFAITEDLQGRMLFGAANALLAFDNNRWLKIPAPGTGFIRSLAVDSRGLVWFSSSTQIGYLSRMDGGYHVVKVAEGWFGADCRILVNGSEIYIIGEGGLFLWSNGEISK
jgi:hypothetical protein